MRESEIQAVIRKRLNLDGRVRLLRNSVGFDSERSIRYGLGNGSPDLVGVLRNGRMFALEVKTPSGRISTEQTAWWVAARRWNVAGGIVHSVEEALTLLEDACAPPTR